MTRPSFKPNKRVPEGSTKAVIARLYDDAGGAKTVAFELGLGIARTYQLAEEGSLSLDDAARLSFASGSTSCAEYFAALTGGVFTTIAPAAGTMRELLVRVAREAGDVFAAMTDPDNHGALAAEIDDCIRALTAARSRIAPVALVSQ